MSFWYAIAECLQRWLLLTIFNCQGSIRIAGVAYLGFQTTFSWFFVVWKWQVIYSILISSRRRINQSRLHYTDFVRGHFNWHGLPLITQWISNHMTPVKCEIIFPFTNCNICTVVEVWKCKVINKFHPTFYNGCNYVSLRGLRLIHVSWRSPWCIACDPFDYRQGDVCVYSLQYYWRFKRPF